jgi:hypothetical protein
MVELTSTSASNGTRNWYLYWYRCISSVDVFITGPSGVANGRPDGELDLFGAPPSMNLADECSPEAGSGTAKDEDN